MFRQIKNNLPDVAERMLMALYAGTMRVQPPKGTAENWVCLMEGRGVAKIIGGEWSSYRHGVMLKLQESGWVICQKGVVRGTATKEIWRYAITCKAFAAYEEKVYAATRGWYLGYDGENQDAPMLPGMEV